MRLTDLAQVLRDAGLPVVEVSGWQTRGRGTDGGQYTNGRPDAVMVHHTASNTSAQNDVNYMTFNSSSRPIANLYIARDGAVWVMAAGPTNTNGSGGPLANVARDNMNRHAIGIEIGNTGTGQVYPDIQQDASLRAAAACCRAYGIPSSRVWAHFEWTSRKIDPSGPARWSNNANRQWDMNRFRSDVQNLIAAPTPPTPDPTQEIEMIALDWQPNTPNWTAFAWTGTHLSHVVDGHADNVMRSAGVGRQTVNDAALLGIIRSSSTTSAAPSTLTPEMAAAW
jgi:N-acetylmuramoyl-L-alanine amidase